MKSISIVYPEEQRGWISPGWSHPPGSGYKNEANNGRFGVSILYPIAGRRVMGASWNGTDIDKILNILYVKAVLVTEASLLLWLYFCPVV